MLATAKIPQAIAFLLGIFALAGISGCGGGGGTSGGGGGGTNPPPVTLLASFTPRKLSVNPGTTFPVNVQVSVSGSASTPSITLGTLTTGFTTTSAFPLSVPSQGTTIQLTVASSVAAGNYSIPATVSDAGTSAPATITVQVVSGVSSPAGLATGNEPEIAVKLGGSASIQLNLTDGDYADIAISAGGLPMGVTATISPQLAVPLDTITVTLSATSNAPLGSNLPVMITATPEEANAAPSSEIILLDVVPTSGAGWSNQTSFVPTRATPIAAVYDPVHQLIYSANQVWNRIDVISDTTRAVVKTISIRDPRAMVLSIDGSTVWVANGAQGVYAINTSNQTMTYNQLPRFGVSATNQGESWEAAQILALADGTVMVNFSPYTGNGTEDVAIWNPANNSLTQSTAFSKAPWGILARSGDGKHVFSIGGDELETSFVYDVVSGTLSNPISLVGAAGAAYASSVAANFDGSKVAISQIGGPFELFDGNLNFIGNLPGDGGGSSFPAEGQIYGGFVFSADGSTIYEETESTVVPAIVTVDVATQQTVALAPAMPVLPIYVELSSGFFIPVPFAVDANGMVLGIEYEGIAFDDSTAHIIYSPEDPGVPNSEFPYPFLYTGPIGGGTQLGITTASPLTPDAYFGPTLGASSLSQDFISITSPPASAAEVVDLKLLYPGGSENFDPQTFTYGTVMKDAIVSASGPSGGVQASLDGFGLPIDPSQDTVMVGGNAATVTSTKTQYPPFTGEQTAMLLSYTVPAGIPGRADLTVKTPSGSSTLSKALLYAQSVTDYPLSDSPTFVLYDRFRNQVYLSGGNHIDVFSLSSMSFATPLSSPASGSQFQGLSLTPDGSSLLAADLGSGALAVFNPDSPSSSYEISVPGSLGTFNTCPLGPLFVAADNQENALVVAGSPIAPGPGNCSPGIYSSNALYVVNLAKKTSAPSTLPGCGATASFISGSHDGSLIAFTANMTGSFRIYQSAQQACIPGASPAQQFDVSTAGDGNVLALDRAFTDTSGNIIGRSAYPTIFYPSAASSVYYNFDPYRGGALLNATLNDAGSLIYWAYPGYIDIVDVQHGTPALRLALTETVTNVSTPMAIDAGGQNIFLITNKGLTVVDLGNSPLSIGHFSQSSSAPGTQIEVRGSGFEPGITATVNGVNAPVTYNDAETLTLTVPSTTSGPQDLVLSNPDGISYTLQNGIIVQ